MLYLHPLFVACKPNEWDTTIKNHFITVLFLPDCSGQLHQNDIVFFLKYHFKVGKKKFYSVGCFERTETLGMKSTTKYQILSSLLQCLPHIYADSLCIAYTRNKALRTITHLYAIATHLLLFFCLSPPQKIPN